MRSIAVGFLIESGKMLGSNFGAVEKAVSYILSQPDGKRSKGIADLRRFADRIVSPLSVCEKTGGCGGGCSGMVEVGRSSPRNGEYCFCLGSIGVL